MKTRFLFLALLFVPLLSIAQANDEVKTAEWLKNITANAIEKPAPGGKFRKAHAGLALYFSQAGNIRVPYLVQVPKLYDPNVPTRVVVFLHGAILARDSFQYKSPEVADEPVFRASDRFNVLVVFPFARADFAWGRNEAANEHIMDIIKQVEQTYNVDKSKVYIGGISMGGNATYWFVNNKAGQFAGFYAFSSFPQESTVQLSHISEKKPLYTMNAKDDQVFSFAEVAAFHEKHKKDTPGWHFDSVEKGGHRFIYSNGGRLHIEALMSSLLGIPLFEH